MLQILHEYRNTHRRACDMMLVVMPYRNADVYAAVKEVSDIHTGVMSQCLLFKNVQVPASTYCRRIE